MHLITTYPPPTAGFYLYELRYLWFYLGVTILLVTILW